MVKWDRGSRQVRQPVVGLYERTDGRVFIECVPDTTRTALQAVIRGKVSLASTLVTDEWTGYDGLEQTYRGHQRIAHAAQEYGHGPVHINGIEGFWAYARERLLKHHGVRPEHLETYLKAIAFRFNHRHLGTEAFVQHGPGGPPALWYAEWLMSLPKEKGSGDWLTRAFVSSSSSSATRSTGAPKNGQGRCIERCFKGAACP